MRNRLTRVFWLAAFAFAANGLSAAPALSPQSNSASGVTVKATPRVGPGGIWEFAIVLETHSQDLSDDLTKTAVLIAGDGVTHSPVDWQGDPPGGHHREGILRFKAVKTGSPTIELRIQRPGEPSARTFRWQLE